MYDRLNASTVAACEMAKLLTLNQLHSLSRETTEWLDEHFRLDAEREVREKEEQKRIKLAAQAKQKLTQDELEALGIHHD